MPSRLKTPWLAVGLAMLAATPAVAEPAAFMMRAMVGEQLVEGQPLDWNRDQMLLLGRDGALYEFKPDQAKGAKRLGPFVGYSSGEMKSILRAEFDRSFDISTTAHFVVVHPRGSGSAWAERLESLYRSFTHYMGVRGFQTTPPTTPLAAVVFRSRDDYFCHAARGGVLSHAGTLGHYDPLTNRVFLFDVSDSNGDGQGDGDWSANAETIIHEATHQTAYNVGVHRRFADQPRWAVEGLAMMFEARGVWNAAAHREQADRLNRDRLDYFRRTAEERPVDWLVRLVASDVNYETDALAAYAQSWALTFYLCETRPQAYSDYLARVTNRELFSKYDPLERMADFTAVFGGDLTLLAAQLNRFVETLP